MPRALALLVAGGCVAIQDHSSHPPPAPPPPPKPKPDYDYPLENTSLREDGLLMPTVKDTYGDFTLHFMPNLYDEWRKAPPGTATCLFGSFSTLWHGTIRAFYPRLQASHLCCGGRMNACTRKGNDPPPYPNNNRPASSKRRAQWQRFSNYARSAECPMLELGRAAIRRQRNDSFLTSILSTPDINATTLAASRRIPFLQYLDARRTVLLVGRKPRSGGVSNGRAIKNMKAIVAAVREWAADAGWAALAPLYLERDDMTHEVQAALFSRATIVIAQHGAALHNIAFGHPANTTVIELPPIWQNGWQQFSSALKMDYHAGRILKTWAWSNKPHAKTTRKPLLVDVNVQDLKQKLCLAAMKKRRDTGAACRTRRLRRRGPVAPPSPPARRVGVARQAMADLRGAWFALRRAWS